MSKEKQIEEMAKDICEIQYKGMKCDVCNLECDCRLSAEAFYNAGYRKQEWISVDERLPERLTHVIVHDEDGTVGEAFYLNGDVFEWVANEKMAFVTHWMPLPEAPKMKGGE